jgi:chemotaxis protein CheX
MATANKVASKFAGVEMTQAHPDFSDALGELANMVAGQAKSKFEGISATISLPSVVIGRDHVVSQSRHAPRLALPCDSVLGRFCVEVAMVVVERRSARTAPAKAAAAAP